MPPSQPLVVERTLLVPPPAGRDRCLPLQPRGGARPAEAAAWHNTGAALYYLKRYEEALAACDRGLALDPNYALALSNKAISLRALGREAEAQDAERRAKELGG